MVFPPEIFGPFIDIGNYERDRKKYKLVKKICKFGWVVMWFYCIARLGDSSKATIMSNFEKLHINSAAETENLKLVNGYKVLDIIGKGAFGIVYDVEKDGQHFAMKEIAIAQYDHTYEHINKEDLQEKDIDQILTENISKEVSILKCLDHPNIVKFYTSFAEGDNIYIIMELHEGMSLTEFIQSLSEKKQRVKEEVAWNIFLQLCSALRYLHNEVRILHRDIAPSNILLDENFTVKLTDFGLATKWGTQSASMNNKSFVGTILYSCPEMVQSKKCTVKADIWSLGAVIYELMMLTQPFKGDNPLLIANRIVKCDYEPIPKDMFSEDLIGAVEQCMTVDTKKRPNIIELCSMYTHVLLLQMDNMRIREINMANKVKMLEK